ncbi:MAG: tetratricopeptide repeat-containing sulfotransferase family protein [Allosphingosinicella sp.]
MSSAAPSPPPALAAAVAAFRRGDFASALRSAEEGLADMPDFPPLLSLAGLAAAQAGDPAGAAPHFRRLLTLLPNDAATRLNLATALAQSGELEEARDACGADSRDPRLVRLAAYLDQQLGRLDDAARGYEAVLAEEPDDFGSWNNLGNVRAALGDRQGAILAFQEAILLNPDVPEIYTNVSEQLAQTEQPDVRQQVMREAARRFPGRADVQAELGLAESGMLDFAAAEQAYREAIRLDPGFHSGWFDLGLLYENLNRVDDLIALVEEVDARGLDQPELGFLRAWALRRQGRFAEALPLAEAVPDTIHPVRRAHLVAELAERTGDTDRAFAAYGEMNRASLAARPQSESPTYRELIAANNAALTAEAVAQWTPDLPRLDPPSPVFIVGFPRSGTTLLDTLLMNMPSLHVLEEPRMLAGAVLPALGPETGIGALAAPDLDRLRALYFEDLGRLSPPAPGQTVVDKNPLLMARAPVIHRLFPDARIVLVERHPCDAVLSCFMANFQLNYAMRSFTSLKEAAATYDVVFESWTRAEALLPLRVHRVRYERMVEDLEGEMRPLLDFLGLPWDETVLDNQSSAARRDHIRTASYSQVTEPIYRRATGRWERYRTHLAPILPILAPWAERLGYPM